MADLLALKGDADRQYPRRAGHRRKGRAGPDRALRLRGAALERAAECERKMYRESLQNNRERILHEQAAGDHRHGVPIELSLEAVQAQRAGPGSAEGVYKELEFFSLLKELGPAEDAARARLPALSERPRPWTRGWPAIPADAPVAVTLARIARRRADAGRRSASPGAG